MAYGLGVDLGNHLPAAAVSRDGRVEPFSLGTAAAAIPSRRSCPRGRDVPRPARRPSAGAAQPSRPGSPASSSGGSATPTPILLGGAPVLGRGADGASCCARSSPQVTEREGGAPGQSCVTHPANWGPFKTDLLRAGGAAGRPRPRPSRSLTEPEAAAIHYASSERVETGDVVAVYDLGGGTFDAAVLRKTPTGFEIARRARGHRAARRHRLRRGRLRPRRRRRSAASSSELDPDDPTRRAAVARLRDECVEAKEALSPTPNVDPGVRPGSADRGPADPGGARGDDPAAHPRDRRRARAGGRDAGIGMADVGRILLVGGSSRDPR